MTSPSLIEEFGNDKRAMPSWAWFHEAFRCFLGNSNCVEQSLAGIVAKSQLLGLDAVHSCLSIGPGNGDVDIPLLKMMPNCGKFYGVDPDCKAVDQLEHALHTDLPGLETEITRDVVQNFAGPKESVDLALVIHMLYCVNELDVAQLCEKLANWTKPGGRVVVAYVIKGLPGGHLFSDIMRVKGCDHLGVLKKGMSGKAKLVSEEECELVVNVENRDPKLAVFIAGSPLTSKQVDDLFDFLESNVPGQCFRRPIKILIFEMN